MAFPINALPGFQRALRCYDVEEMEEMETEMLKDHEAIDALVRDARKDGMTAEGEKARDIQMPEGVSKAAEAVYKILFPLVTTALASVVRVVVEKAIGG